MTMKLRDHVFVIDGIRPVPQGSVRAFKVGDRAVVTHSKSSDLMGYRQVIADTVRHEVPTPTRSAVTIRLTFCFPRPKNHIGKKGVLPSAPNYFTTKPDVDKLARSVMDALTGTLYVDDSQVYRLMAIKQYAEDKTYTMIEATWWEA